MSKLSDISSYFDEKVLDQIINVDGGVKCTSWNFAGGFKKGDSYLSEVFRLQVEGVKSNNEPVKTTLVIKSIPKNVGRRKTFRSDEFFRNEIYFYKSVWKNFVEFQNNKPELKNPFSDIPKCYSFYCDGENDYIALEDLSQFGYGTSLRQNGMNFEHCKLIMQTLGLFHALSLAYRDQKPEEFQIIVDQLEECYYGAKIKTWYNDFIKIQVDIAKDALAKEYGGTEIEKAALNFLNGDIYDKMVALTHTRTKYAVITHGDCWTPNFLMLYDSQQVPQQIKLIDFQLARYSSPALDLSFFINSCTTQELREKHYDELIEIYHKSTTDSISDLGSDPQKVFPFEGLQSELEQFARFGCGMGIESIPFSLLEDDDTFDLDLIEGDEAVPITTIWLLKNIETKEGRLRLADTFKHAYNKNYLN